MSTATVPRATGYPVPASGAALNSEPVRTQLVNIVDFLEGGNIAQGNVDVTEVATLATANTWTANQTITATFTVGVDDTGYDVRFYGATSGKSFLWDESADQLTITGNISVSDGATLPTGTTIGNLTLANGSITDSSGAISFGNENLTTTGTLSAGATTVTSLAVSTDDGGAIGASGTAFSDLFLASGGVINFNAGDVTLVHSANKLTMVGGDFVADNTTASSSLSTGAITTNGGVGVAKAIYVGNGIHSVYDNEEHIFLDRTANANVDNVFEIGVSADGAGGTTDFMFLGSDANNYVLKAYSDGRLGMGLLATEQLILVDAGSTSATEQDWIEVTVGGNTGYIRVFATK